ncbi:MAG: zinc ribbon domain-containing protein [candidate division WOR-3 bacterium]
MPIYEYKCETCEKSFEELVLPGEKEPEKCPECGTKTLRKVWRGSVGLIFKGSGFYITDYARKTSSGGKKEGEKEKESKGNSCCSGGSCSCE